jgi:putative two-component system response regulator
MLEWGADMKLKGTILVVNDEPLGRERIQVLLMDQGYGMNHAGSGVEALAKAAEDVPDLILLDVKMPGMIQVCRQLRADPLLSEIPMLMLIEADDRDGRLLGLEAGADDFCSKPLDVIALRARVRSLIRLNWFRKRTEEEREEDTDPAVITAFDAVLESWGQALELRDLEPPGHVQRVTDMTVQLAHAMGMSDAELVHVRRGALLHDIGKMGVPDRIILKLGPLDDEEWEIMRKHPVYAYELLSSISYLQPALDIPYSHHEWWDGSGYPRGLKGEEIPLAARIFAVIDVWDALHSDRSYRRAWAKEQVDDYIHEEAGKHFDPDVVEVFFGLLT